MRKLMLGFAVAVFIAVAGSVAQAVEYCYEIEHRRSNGSTEWIIVGEGSLQRHLNHGDSTYYPFGSCNTK